MPDLQIFTDWFLDVVYKFWAFLTSGWFVSAILFVKFLLPRLVNVFKRFVGR